MKLYQAERQKTEGDQLREMFRQAVPYIGPDPKYAFHPRSSEPERPRSGQQQQKQSPPRDKASRLNKYDEGSKPASLRSDGVVSTKKAGNRVALCNTLDDGGIEVGVEKGYTEPSYITRQRCLVLNEWALDLQDRGEYAKARGAAREPKENSASFASLRLVASPHLSRACPRKEHLKRGRVLLDICKELPCGLGEEQFNSRRDERESDC